MEITYTNKPDFNYIAQVMAELLSRQYDANVKITVTPKTPEQLKEEEDIKNAV